MVIESTHWANLKRNWINSNQWVNYLFCKVHIAPRTTQAAFFSSSPPRLCTTQSCTLHCSLCCSVRCKPHQNAEGENVCDRVRRVESKNKPSHQNFTLLVTDPTIHFCVPPFPPHACVASQLFTGSLTRFCFRCQEACSLFKNLLTPAKCVVTARLSFDPIPQLLHQATKH